MGSLTPTQLAIRAPQAGRCTTRPQVSGGNYLCGFTGRHAPGMSSPHRPHSRPLHSPTAFALITGLLGAMTVLLATVLPLPPPASATPLALTFASSGTTPLSSTPLTGPEAGHGRQATAWAMPAPLRLDAPQFTPAVAHELACRGRHTRAGTVWPMGRHRTVRRAFAPPAVRWGSGHRGVDLAAPAGSPVMAPVAGRVRFAGTVAGKPVVSVSHSGGLVTTYEPVAATVAVGQEVRPGDVIGTLLAGHGQADAASSDVVDGVTGTARGTAIGTAIGTARGTEHDAASSGSDPPDAAQGYESAGGGTASSAALHWGARTGRHTYVNPLRLVCAPRIRLKPAPPGA